MLFATRGGVTALVQRNVEDQSASSSGSSKVLRTLVDFLCLGKTTTVIKILAIYEVLFQIVFTQLIAI